MRLLDSLNSQLIWQMPCILNLYAVIIYSDANAATWRIQQSMAKCICQGFTQSFGRYFQFLLSADAFDDATQIQVFEKECHTSVKQIKIVAFDSLIIYKCHLIYASETSHS